MGSELPEDCSSWAHYPSCSLHNRALCWHWGQKDESGRMQVEPEAWDTGGGCVSHDCITSGWKHACLLMLIVCAGPHEKQCTQWSSPDGICPTLWAPTTPWGCALPFVCGPRMGTWVVCAHPSWHKSSNESPTPGLPCDRPCSSLGLHPANSYLICPEARMPRIFHHWRDERSEMESPGPLKSGQRGRVGGGMKPGGADVCWCL